jgi:hypothetical protein
VRAEVQRDKDLLPRVLRFSSLTIVMYHQCERIALMYAMLSLYRLLWHIHALLVVAVTAAVMTVVVVVMEVIVVAVVGGGVVIAMVVECQQGQDLIVHHLQYLIVTEYNDPVTPPCYNIILVVLQAIHSFVDIAT